MSSEFGGGQLHGDILIALGESFILAKIINLMLAAGLHEKRVVRRGFIYLLFVFPKQRLKNSVRASQQTLTVSIAKGSRLMICLNFSNNVHHTLSTYGVLTQSVHTAACLSGCDHHRRGIHLVG